MISSPSRKNKSEQELNQQYKECDHELNSKSFFLQWGNRVETELLDNYKEGEKFHTYTPSIWTLTFMEGINKIEFPPNSKPRIMEIGVGTGLATAFMAEKWPNAEIFCCDIEEKAITLAERNISAISGKNALERCHFFASDVLLPLKTRNATHMIDAIFGNLPLEQTNILTQNELREGSTISVLYPAPYYITRLNDLISDKATNSEKKKSYRQILDQYTHNPHLLLHRILFAEARDVLAPGGSLVVTCSDSDKSQMEKLLHEHGFHAKVSAINYEHEDEEGYHTHQSNIIYAINASL